MQNINDTPIQLTFHECAICLDQVSSHAAAKLNCTHGRHYFHAECIGFWFKQNLTCPACRDEYSAKSITRLLRNPQQSIYSKEAILILHAGIQMEIHDIRTSIPDTNSRSVLKVYQRKINELFVRADDLCYGC